MGLLVDHAAELRVLAVTATRRDGEVTRGLLARADIDCVVCRNIRELVSELPSGAGAILLTEAAFADASLPELVAALDMQPPWSEVSILVFARERSRTRRFERGITGLRNVILLDLPSSARAMVSAVGSALRGRRRQYELREQIVAELDAQAALRDADRRKDEFLATLAHELRNPLATICTGVALMDRYPEREAERPRMLAMMDRQSKLLIKLIDDLLDVSRIATGKLMLARERIDLREVIDAAVETSRPSLEAAKHELRLALPDSPTYVVGDAQRLTQVVGNILRNAAKYTPPQGHVEVSLVEKDGMATIAVRDDGIGIPDDMQGRVFDLFTQVNQSLDRSQGGLGIGLSLVKKLVELHDGAVTVNSAGSGQGSTFTISVPVDAGPSAAVPLDADAGTPMARRELRVLIIDDNVDVADSFAALLELDGYVTKTAYSGPAGLAANDAFRPNVVFCDIGLPGMSGHEVAQRLRADPKNDAMFLVAVTGWGNADDRTRTKAAGFDLHLTKPVSQQDVDGVFARFG